METLSTIYFWASIIFMFALGLTWGKKTFANWMVKLLLLTISILGLIVFLGLNKVIIRL